MKSYALEKGISLVGFALDLAVGGTCDVGQTVKDRLFNVVKDECINLAKTYANNYIANKIVKKLINLLQNNLKSFIITPLMDNMIFDGENIERCIQYDIINGNDENKELIIDKCNRIFDELDNLIDFIGPIIELCKILISKNNEEKLSKLLDFLSTIDYNSLSIIKDKVCSILKDSKICNESKNELSSLIKSIDSSLDEETVDEICKELIEYGIINKNGELNKKISPIKGFEQSFKLNIDEKYSKYEYNNKKTITDKIKEKVNLNLIFGKMNKVNFNNKKNEIKEEMYNRLETFIQAIIEKILELVEDKVGEQLEKLYQKYKKKKKSQNGELDNENDVDGKKVKKKGEEGEEENTIQISKTANSNQNGEEEKINVSELNAKEIKKNKKETEMKESAITLISEKNSKKLLKETSQFCAKFGIKAGINNIVIPRLINLLCDFVKDQIKKKLLPMIFDRFDEHFEKFGEHMIILQKKYKIKGYLDTLIKLIRQFFHIITGIQTFIIPILKNLVNKIKKGEDCHKIICKLNQELISKVDNNFLIPFKDFIKEVFGEKGSVEKYKFFEKIIEEGYKKVKGICVEKYEGELKTFASKKYDEIKNYYFNKKKKICELLNELVKKYEQTKQEIKNRYNQKKEKIINETNKQIDFLKTFNFNIEFKKISKALKSIITEKLDELKNECKNTVNNIDFKFLKYFDDFNSLIDKISNLKFEHYEDKKIKILDTILNFILDIEAGNIAIKEKNEAGEEIHKDGIELLNKYLAEKLELQEMSAKIIIEYLLKKGLKSIIIKRINLAINFGQKKYDKIKQYCEPIKKLIKTHISTMKEDAAKFLEKNKEKVNKKIDSGFEYFIKFINFLFKKASVLDLYTIKIEVSNNFRKKLVENLIKLRDKAISEITVNFEKIMGKIEKQLDEEIKKIQGESNEKLNDLVNKYENEIFGNINKFLNDEKSNSKNNNKNKKSIETKNEMKIDIKTNKNIFDITNDTLITKDSQNEILIDSNILPDIAEIKENNEKNNSIYDIPNLEESEEYKMSTKYDSNDEDSLGEYYDIADKEIREKDKKYHMTRIENKINRFSPTYEEETEEQVYDFYFGNEEEKEEEKKEEKEEEKKEEKIENNRIEQEEDIVQLLNIKYDLDDKDNLVENNDIKEGRINKNNIIEISNDNNNKEIGKTDIKNNNKLEQVSNLLVKKNNYMTEKLNESNITNKNNSNITNEKNSQTNLNIESSDKNEIKKYENKNDTEEQDIIEKEDKNDEKKMSEFDKFDKSIGRIVDGKIRKSASKLEQKMINFVKNSKATDFLKKKLSGQMNRQKFDKFIKSVENIKEKELNFLQSDKVKNGCKNLDKYIKKFSDSKTAQKTIDFIDNFDAKKYNRYADKADSYIKLFDSETKEQFRDNCKKLIEDELLNLYADCLEPKIKEIAINLGKLIVDKIGDKITKKK